MRELFDVARDDDVVLSVWVQPGATRAGIAGRHGNALKLKVTARAEGGKANAAVARLLARELGIRRSDVEIVSGTASRAKRVLLHGVGGTRIAAWLDKGGVGSARHEQSASWPATDRDPQRT